MELFVQNLRKRAEELGLSQAEVARRAGLSEKRFGNYATGVREPDLATLLKIASVLGTTPNDLLGVGSQQAMASTQLLRGRLAAAAATMSDDDLSILVIEAEAIAAFRAVG